MRFPNPRVSLPDWRWLDRIDVWRLQRGILTGRWTEQEIAEQRRRGLEIMQQLKGKFDVSAVSGIDRAEQL